MSKPETGAGLPPASENDAREAVRSAQLVEKTAGLNAAGRAWQEARVLGLDTEFVRERTFTARPGLVQISDGVAVWLLDAVALPGMPALAEQLGDAGTIKVLHSVGEDLDVLHAVSGAWPEPLFDTQVAAAMTGMPLQCRYETLVESVIGASLPGGKARNDWCRRPLAPDLLEYAAQDVIWLPRLYETLSERLERAGRLAWLREDCARLVAEARRGDTTPPLARVKGAGRLPTPVVARLAALADWREDEAQRRDLPRRFVVSDEVLIEVAQAAASDNLDAALARLPDRLRARRGDAVAEVLRSRDFGAFERPAWFDVLDGEERERLKAAQSAVRELADELSIDPAVIASKKALIPMIRGERPEWLDGWRGEVLTGRLKAASVNIPPPEA